MPKRMKFSPQPITAADENEDTRVADLSSDLKDDFNYLLDGFERLDRNGLTNETLEVMNQIYNAVDDAIRQIAELTDNGSSPVESTTDIQAATLEDLKDSVETKIAELEDIPVM